MQLSAVLDIVIGLAFVFFLLSLASSAIAEWLASLLQKRAKYLLRGLRTMLGGTEHEATTTSGRSPSKWPTLMAEAKTGITRERKMHADALAALNEVGPNSAPGQPMASDRPAAPEPAAPRMRSPDDILMSFLGHPLVAAQAQRRAAGPVTRGPSYLSASTFATAVLGMLLTDNAEATLTDRIKQASLPEPLQKALIALARQADDNIAHFTTALEHWYDSHMARVSGFYKRWVKRWILVIAAVIVLVLHVDAISLAGTLWHNPEVRQATAALATSSVCDAQRPVAGPPVADQTSPSTADYLDCLNEQFDRVRSAGLGIGQPAECGIGDPAACLLPPAATTGWRVISVLVGLVLSVLAASYGAPFWFQVLTRAGSLRNTGDKPQSSA